MWDSFKGLHNNIKTQFCTFLVFRGGVMLVHSIRKNETRVIDFRETAPSAIHEDMLQTNLDINVRLYFSLI